MTINATNKGKLPKPSASLYRHVRAGFVIKGHSLSRYCKDNKDELVYARQVLLGQRNGPKAREFRQRLITAAGLLNPNSPVRLADDVATSEAA